MREEFHGNGLGGAAWKGKLLYGWNTLNVNIWLPSLCELVGYNPDKYYDPNGCYYSAMQGLNLSSNWYTDAQGGNQFAYFKQFNASGGGESIMKVCNQQQSWLRSSSQWNSTHPWRTINAATSDTAAATGFLAVHPAVLYNLERPGKQ